jgi:DNA-binding HxlR family transcriptional regulator
MKKIDILNFITNFRKSPNDIKTYSELVNHLGAANEQALSQMLNELLQLKVVRQIEVDGEKAYQVTSK